MHEMPVRKLDARRACRVEVETNEESEEQDCLLLMKALGTFYLRHVQSRSMNTKHYPSALGTRVCKINNSFEYVRSSSFP